MLICGMKPVSIILCIVNYTYSREIDNYLNEEGGHHHGKERNSTW